IDFDGGAAADCLAEMRSHASCEISGFFGDNPCAQVFTGTVAEGGACTFDTECVGDATCTETDPACDANVACCAGTCGAASLISAEGGPCGDDVHLCDDGLYCSTPDGASAGTCTAQV